MSTNTAAIPKVTSDKPHLPTLWLDTSIVIKMTKIARGEKLEAVEVERLTRLKDITIKLVGAGKLLCPEADQEEEYVALRLDKEVHGMFADLSLGIRLRHRQGMFDYQVQLGIKAQVETMEAIHVPLDCYFPSDPIEQLKEARKRPFVFVVSLFKDAEMIERSNAAKVEIQRVWEGLRQEFVAGGRTYDEELSNEQRGYADAVIQRIEDFESKTRSGISPDFWELMGAQGFLLYKVYWAHLGGQPAGNKGVYDYFCSSYFNNLPIPRIRAQLGADLLTGNEPILSGDMMDVEMLSAAIPVSHFVVTDKRMSSRIKRLAIDKDWNTEVYSMSEIDGLFERLERL